MESTGERGRIQLSQSTADLIMLSGKGQWLVPRNEIVTAKGKGSMQTFWLEMNSPKVAGRNTITGQSTESLPMELGGSESSDAQNSKNARSISWMTEVLLDYVKQIVRML
jgi:Adenylate and Guanylate cyclase catalytic domain